MKQVTVVFAINILFPKNNQLLIFLKQGNTRLFFGILLKTEAAYMESSITASETNMAFFTFLRIADRQHIKFIDHTDVPAAVKNFTKNETLRHF
jgi:hypothetical protein